MLTGMVIPQVGRAVQVASIKTRFDSAAWCQRLKLEYDEPLSNLAFNFNLRRYSALGCRRRIR